MTNPLLDILSVVPRIALASVVGFLLLMFLGWLLSMRAGSKSEQGSGLKLLLFLPITTPIALLVLLIKDRSAAKVPCLTFIAGFVVLIVGGKTSEFVERKKLDTVVQNLADQGENIEIDSMIPEPVAGDQNIWEHPFLKPIADAAKPSSGGDAPELSVNYEQMSIPKDNSSILYDPIDEQTEGWRQIANKGSLLRVHKMSLSAIQLRDGSISDATKPKTWAATGSVLLEHFEPAKSDFQQLQEALSRPADRYPYNWEDAIMMSMPHMAQTKGFSQSVVTRSQSYILAGKGDEAFEDIKLAFKLINLGNSDILISQLVQIAQLALTLNAVETAQQFHVWNDVRWQYVQAALNKIDFPAAMPDSMRAERVFANATMDPIIRARISEAIQGLDNFGATETPIASGFSHEDAAKSIADFLIGGFARANLTAHWRLAIEAYSHLIKNIETGVADSHRLPWSQLDVTMDPTDIKEYGVFGRMLLASLGTAFDKSIMGQTKVRLSIVACALERFYLAHQRYPESLSNLTPRFLPTVPIDPMGRKPWNYRLSEGKKGFVLYSVGKNGFDDGGYSDPRTSSYQPSGRDDIVWSIADKPPALPGFQLSTRAARPVGQQMNQEDQEMMQRYGL
jgi:hypothetical protein